MPCQLGTVAGTDSTASSSEVPTIRSFRSQAGGVHLAWHRTAVNPPTSGLLIEVTLEASIGGEERGRCELVEEISDER